MITMQAPRRLRLATTSSPRMAKIWLDQPRMTVWSFSTTNDRPLRSSCSRPITPLPISPMKVPPTNMLVKLSTSIAAMNDTPPSVASGSATALTA
jgi:hypothetical protein